MEFIVIAVIAVVALAAIFYKKKTKVEAVTSAPYKAETVTPAPVVEVTPVVEVAPAPSSFGGNSGFGAPAGGPVNPAPSWGTTPISAPAVVAGFGGKPAPAPVVEDAPVVEAALEKKPRKPRTPKVEAPVAKLAAKKAAPKKVAASKVAVKTAPKAKSKKV